MKGPVVLVQDEAGGGDTERREGGGCCLAMSLSFSFSLCSALFLALRDAWGRIHARVFVVSLSALRLSVLPIQRFLACVGVHMHMSPVVCGVVLQPETWWDRLCYRCACFPLFLVNAPHPRMCMSCSAVLSRMCPVVVGTTLDLLVSFFRASSWSFCCDNRFCQHGFERPCHPSVPYWSEK